MIGEMCDGGGDVKKNEKIKKSAREKPGLLFAGENYLPVKNPLYPPQKPFMRTLGERGSYGLP